MKKVKITVKKIVCHKDLMREYENPIEHACNMEEGQIYICEDAQCPKNFCDGAWQSLYPFVLALATGGGDFFDGWMKNPKSAMLACNDGFRPVSFLVETMEQESCTNPTIKTGDKSPEFIVENLSEF